MEPDNLARAITVAASRRSNLEQPRPAGDGQARSRDEDAVMPGLRGPGCLDLKRILGRSTKIDAIELPLVGKRLTCHSRDVKA